MGIDTGKMAASVSARNLTDKKVMDTAGGEIGVYHNIIIDVDMGVLTALVVKPATDLDTRRFDKESDYILVPFEAVKAVQKVIIVDSERI
jgi:sporulation protein YlmC with PRC-barrel domain